MKIGIIHFQNQHMSQMTPVKIYCRHSLPWVENRNNVNCMSSVMLSLVIDKSIARLGWGHIVVCLNYISSPVCLMFDLMVTLGCS